MVVREQDKSQYSQVTDKNMSLIIGNKTLYDKASTLQSGQEIPFALNVLALMQRHRLNVSFHGFEDMCLLRVGLARLDTPVSDRRLEPALIIIPMEGLRDAIPANENRDRVIGILKDLPEATDKSVIQQVADWKKKRFLAMTERVDPKALLIPDAFKAIVGLPSFPEQMQTDLMERLEVLALRGFILLPQDSELQNLFNGIRIISTAHNVRLSSQVPTYLKDTVNGAINGEGIPPGFFIATRKEYTSFLYYPDLSDKNIHYNIVFLANRPLVRIGYKTKLSNATVDYPFFNAKAIVDRFHGK